MHADTPFRARRGTGRYDPAFGASRVRPEGAAGQGLFAVQGKDPADLEFTPSDMQAMGEAALRRVVDHLATIGEQAVRGDVDAAEYCRTMREAAPEQGSPIEPLLDSLFNDWIPRTYNTASPGYLAFIPSGGVFPPALADLIANGVNRYTGVWRAAPALVQLEANVLDWMRDWMQFPQTTRGVFTTGGSTANFTAIVCARERELGPDIRAGVMYASDQVHHSVVKSARLAGVMPDRIRAIPVDSAFRMRVDALEDAVRRDRAAGLRPFLVVSSAGTTNTGAVDPLPDIAAVCRAAGLWHHVDGAYGAFFHMCPELRPILEGLPQADSLTLDPHKGLFLPYGTGALLVADGNALRAAHSVTASYMPANQEDADLYDPHQFGPDLSRGFPGLRVWLSVKLYGAARYRAAIAEKRALALRAAELIGAIPHIVMDAPPQLSLLAFHLEWPGSTLDQQNAATRELQERVTQRGKVMLTGCEAGGRHLARVCVLSFRTRRDRIDVCAQHLAEDARAIASPQ
jgi:aromatic-L-amino-acid/L-tryptophan decarboxylase